ncbi:MAG TPA: TIR domain-containing protein [Caulobacteraceae bacterium]|nr:TIR domain-containing protein [Caulobacteraceae bacterium]
MADPTLIGDPAPSGAPPPSGHTTVFLSYSRADERRARPIIEVLERAGYSVWWDGLLGGGERFAQATAEALERARAVVVVWSKTSIDSHWVHDEAAFARDHGRLVPLSLDGAMPPLGFRQFQVIDVSRARRDSPEMRQLIEAVAALHDAPAALRTPRAAAAGGATHVRRNLLLGAGASALALGGLAIAWRTGVIGPAPARPNTLAVLPFANLSGDPTQAYFTDGLAAEVRAALARNAALRVVGQVSSEVFKSRTEDAKAIARALDVAFLLDGNVRRAGDRVRVAAELIDGATGFSRWSQTFERSLDDIFAVQSQIAAAVTEAITSQVAQAEQKIRSGDTDNVAAFDAYLKGRAAFALAAGPETDRDALTDFETAIAADPGFAAAQAARSRTLVAIANEDVQGAERGTLYTAAIEAARKAVQLAPELADAYSALAYALASGRLDIKGARGPYQKSYALGGGQPDIVARYALYCAQTGRIAEAETAIAQAETLDPLNPRTFWNAGYIRYAARRYADARQLWRQALALNPRMASAHGHIAYILILEGQLRAAGAELAQEPSALTRLPGMAILAHRQGDEAGAHAAYDQLVARIGDDGLYQQAQVLSQWGLTDQALNMLQRARQAADSGLFLAREDPLLDPLRRDHRYSELLLQLGFD